MNNTSLIKQLFYGIAFLCFLWDGITTMLGTAWSLPTNPTFGYVSGAGLMIVISLFYIESRAIFDKNFVKKYTGYESEMASNIAIGIWVICFFL